MSCIRPCLLALLLLCTMQLPVARADDADLAPDDPPTKEHVKDKAKPGPDKPAPDPPPDNADADPNAATGDQASPDADPAATDGKGDTPPPEGVRRRRPQTAAEEREYKLRRTREDPFLNPPLATGAGNAYNPVDWLAPCAAYDRSKYLVQDAAGHVQGFLDVRSEALQSPLGDLIHATLSSDSPSRTVELRLFAATLKPRSVTVFEGDPADPDTQRTVVDYYFDRVTIQRMAGVVMTQEKMRQLPYSFDIEQLPLLVRQLEFGKVEWPFEALVTDPQHRTSLQMQVTRPQNVDVLTADGQTYHAYELAMRLGETKWTWWVERRAPHRLLKFTNGTLTWTLQSYVPAP